MMDVCKRHILVYLDEEGRREAFQEACRKNPAMNTEHFEELITRERIPAIVKRQEKPRADVLEIGFTSWMTDEGVRLRVSSEVEKKHIRRSVHPLDVLPFAEKMPIAPVIRRLRGRAESAGLRIGLYGSTAMEAVTGLPYRREGSDLDIYAVPTVAGHISCFFQGVTEVEQETGIPIDCEMEIGAGYAVKLKELFTGSRTILAKGYSDVKLVTRRDIGW